MTYINLEYKGLKGIEDFINSTIEIALPPEPINPYKYIHNIEYYLLKQLSYRVVLYERELVNSDKNNYSRISGITLKMYDDIENRKQVHYYSEDTNPIIRFNPYEIYRGCLEPIIKPDNSFHPEILKHLDNIEIYFCCEIYEFNYDNILYLDNYVYSPINIINNNEELRSYLIINELNNYGIAWQIINLNDDEEDENPEKRSKH